MITDNSGIGALNGDITQGGVGVLHGDQYVNQYVLDPTASPERVFAEGMRCLNAGLRERARHLVEIAFGRGHRHSRELFYGWALTIISRRSPEDLTDEEWHPLRTALDGVRRSAPEASNGPADGPADEGGYAEAAALIDDLLTAAITPRDAGGSADADGSGDAAGEPRGAVFELRMAALPPARRAEMADHLRKVWESVERSVLSSVESAEIDASLTPEARGERAARLPLFFTPDPLPLVEPPPVKESALPGDRSGAATVLGIAGAFFVAGLVLALSELAELAAPVLVLLLVFATPAVVLLSVGGRGELRRRARQRRRPPWLREGRPLSPEKARRREMADQESGASPPASEALAFHAFRARLAVLAAARFAEKRPAGGQDPDTWRFVTAQLRSELVERLSVRYWRTGQPEGLDWLLQLRAGQAAHGGNLPPAPRPAYQQWAWVRLGLILLAVALAVPVLPLAVVAPPMALLVLLLWGASVWTALSVGVRLVEVGMAAREMADFADEGRAHAEWSAFLRANRPGDELVGRWIDLEQRAMLRDVLRDHRMRHHGILFTFSLLEPAPDCVRAKVPFGPPRYSRYGLRLFVLTMAGVWVCSWEIDAATAVHDGRRDFVFRFDSISSVVLQTAAARAGSTGLGTAPEPRARTGEVLRLVLNNREDLEVRIEDHHQLVAAGADLGQLREVALETSGVTAGFRVLAALATEGEGWFDVRRAQSRQAFLDEDEDEGEAEGGTGRRPGPEAGAAAREAFGAGARQAPGASKAGMTEPS
ncbi:hypothetical protein [Streptomyces sedi]|uniref:Uncharacterized protein n=1 Tax=Streptomyces sedi TaxID=555059 RepID=A0A5C4V3V5_9ACTN|nr:hypothetical protein [Streptomyces sedi]TNM29749.1 hypothetical protein FH715_13450 [Streptomyces sedi]